MTAHFSKGSRKSILWLFTHLFAQIYEIYTIDGTKMYGKKQHRNIWDEDCLKNGINTSLTKVSNRLKEIPHFSDIGISLIVRDQFDKKLVIRYLVKKLPSLNLSFIPHSKQLSTAMKKNQHCYFCILRSSSERWVFCCQSVPCYTKKIWYLITVFRFQNSRKQI